MSSVLSALNLAHLTPARSEPLARPRSIGELLVERTLLTAPGLEQVLEHQRHSGRRFGEAAIALGLVRRDDVVLALSLQFGYPCLGEGAAASTPQLVMLHQPLGPLAEHFRSLRIEVKNSLRAISPAPLGLAVLSAEAGEGRSFCAANLAVALAQAGESTLLVDADLRRPRLQRLFGVDTRRGLSGLLAGHDGESVIQAVAGVPGLGLLAAGVPPPNPLELLERPAFESFLQQMSTRYTHVVVDTPAATHGADAALIAARCGAALLVARRHNSRYAALHALRAALARGPAHTLGLVLNER